MKFLFILLLTFGSLLKAQTVTTVAGSVSGFLDGLAAAALFNSVNGVSIDGAGNIYIADVYNQKIRKYDPVTGQVSTIAGSVLGYSNGASSGAQFYNPTNICIDATGDVHVADFMNNVIRKISAGNVSTEAGTSWGLINGPSLSSAFASPSGITVHCPTKDLYVVDYNNHAIRKISASGNVSTLAGGGGIGFVDGTGSLARFNLPYGIAIDAGGDVYVADRHNHSIRKVTTSGVVSTIAGTGSPGYLDGAASSAMFNEPCGLWVNSIGEIIVADTYNHVIRKISGGVVTTIAGSVPGFADGPASSAKFDQPSGIAIDKTGNIYVADFKNYRLRKIIFDEFSGAIPGSDLCQLTTNVKEDLIDGFTIFPNPCNEKISIMFFVPVTNEITLHDVLSKTVYHSKLQNQNKWEIDISQLPQGIYFMNVNTENNQITKKIIKN